MATDNMDALERLVEAAPAVRAPATDELAGGAFTPQGSVTVSAPNFLSKKARRDFAWALTLVGGATFVLGFLLIAYLHADTSGNWVLPTNVLMVLGGASLLLAYFTVGGFGNVAVTVGDGSKAPAAEAAPSIKVTPSNGATNVDPKTVVTATFATAVDKDTVNETSFLLKQGTTAVGATVAYDEATKTATLKPSADLAAGKDYVATITTGVKDGSGSPLPAEKTWSFTTKA
jgi:hypothetical protein